MSTTSNYQVKITFESDSKEKVEKVCVCVCVCVCACVRACVRVCERVSARVLS